MKKRIARAIAGLMAAAFAAFGAAAVPAAADAAGATITIFHTNDMHGHLIDTYDSSKTLTTLGTDYVVAIRKSVPDALLVDAGDASQGVPFANVSKGADVIKLTNAAGFDLGVLGNHEFDYGVDQMLANVKNSDYPTLSANTLINGAPILKDVDGQGLAGNNGCDLIKTVKGVKIGFFGIDTPETAYKTNPSYLKSATGSVTFEDPIAVSQAEIDKLKGEGAQVIVGIMHIGDDPMSAPNSIAIAQKLTGLNVLIDGHSHTVENNVVNGALIVQTGCYGEALGRLDISVGADGTVTPKETLISPAEAQKSYTPDPTVAALAKKLSDAQAPLFEKVVGHTSSALWGGVVNGTSVARLGETNLGDLVADSMADNAKTHTAGTAEANLPIVSLENGGGVRDIIPAGDITQGQVSTVLPFGNILSMKEVTPNVLYQILENGVSKIAGQDASTGKITGADGRFPQVSGMRYTYDPNGTPANTAATPAVAGSRIGRIVLLNADGTDKQALDRNDTATKIVLATNDFEDAGGDGYTMLKNIKNIGEGDALDVIAANYIDQLTKQGGGTFAYPNTVGRISLDTGFSYPDYSAAVTLTDTNGAVAGTQVLYSVDNGSAAYGTTDAKGVLTVSGLKAGPHSLYLYKSGDYAEAYVDGAIGMTAVSADMSAPTGEQVTAANMMRTILDLPAKVTAADAPAVKSALAAYEALTPAQQALVGNSSVLQANAKAVLAASSSKPAGSSSAPASSAASSAASRVSAVSAANAGGTNGSPNAASSVSNPLTGGAGVPLAGAFLVLGISAAALVLLQRTKEKPRK